MSGTAYFFTVIGVSTCVTQLMRFIIWLDEGGHHGNA